MCGSGSCRALAAVALVGCFVLCAARVGKAEVVRLASPQYASLRGYVYADLNHNCELEVGEGVVNGVVIHCTLTATLEGGAVGGGSTTYTTLTNDYGCYTFGQLAPGVYSLREEHPIEFLQGLTGSPGTVRGTRVGEANGPDEFVKIGLAAGDAGVMYNFGESGLRSAYLSKRDLLTYDGDTPVYTPEPAGVLLLATGLVLFLSSAVAGLGRRRS